MQLPDGKPGYYYVTARDRGRTAVLLGPFLQRRPGTLAHRQALGAVAACRGETLRRFQDDDTAFAVFGTCRVPLDYPNPPVGKLGRHTISREA